MKLLIKIATAALVVGSGLFAGYLAYIKAPVWPLIVLALPMGFVIGAANEWKDSL